MEDSLRAEIAKIIDGAAMHHEGSSPWFAAADALLRVFDVRLREPEETP